MHGNQHCFPWIWMSALCHRAGIFSVSLSWKPPYTTSCNTIFTVLNLQASLKWKPFNQSFIDRNKYKSYCKIRRAVWIGKHHGTVRFCTHGVVGCFYIKWGQPGSFLLHCLEMSLHCFTSNNWQDGALSCRRTHFLATYISKMFWVNCLLQIGKCHFLPLVVDSCTLRNNKVVYNALSLEQIFCHLPFQVMLMELHESQQVISLPQWSRSNVLTTGPKFCGFKPSRGWWIFRGEKNL